MKRFCTLGLSDGQYLVVRRRSKCTVSFRESQGVAGCASQAEGLRLPKRGNSRVRPLQSPARGIPAALATGLPSATARDSIQVREYPPEQATQYRLFYQMTRMTREKGALAHDDRLDAVEGAVSYWVEALAQDQKVAADRERDKLMAKELKEHAKNQVDELYRPRRKAQKAAFRLGR